MPATLVPTSPSSQLFLDAKNRFLSEWSNPTKAIPSVVNVFYVNHQGHSVWRNFEAYSRRVGNQKYMWHGTQRACTIGDDNSQLTACRLPDCYLCLILRATLDPTKSTNRDMLGRGAYVAPNSSKSVDYMKNARQGTSLNLVLIRCAVAVGRTYVTKNPMNGAKRPPPGYDSISAVKGYTSNGRRPVSNDETCVFTGDAILPVEIIVLRRSSSLNSTVQNTYSTFTRRLRNVRAADWNKYPEAIRDTRYGEILWTDGNDGYSFASAPNIRAFRVVRRVPENSPTGRVVAEGLASSNTFYFQLE